MPCYFMSVVECTTWDRDVPDSAFILGTAHVLRVLEKNIPLVLAQLWKMSILHWKLLTGYGTLIIKSIPIRCYCTHCIKFLHIMLYMLNFNKIIYSKTCVKRPLSKWPKMVFKTDYHLMQVKSTAECFRPSLSYHLSLRHLFCLLWVAILHRFYCYVMFPKLHVSALILKCI